MAQEVERVGWSPGRLLVWSPSVEVSLSKTPHPNCCRRAGCRPAWLTPLSVCECVHEVLLGSIVESFEWPLVRKELDKCSPSTVYHDDDEEEGQSILYGLELLASD